jgi:hypothetical protein
MAEPLDAQTRDRLAATPPSQFTAARAALAARLRREGREAEAAAVARLKKPTPALWAVNQLARRDRLGLERLLRATDELRSVQLGRPRGEASLAAAAEAQRSALASLVDRAASLLGEAKFRVTSTTRERIAKTLQAAAIEPAARRELQRGHLDRELEPPGFEVFAGVKPGGGSPPRGERRREGREASGGTRERRKRRADLVAARRAVSAATAKARTLAQRATRVARREAEARRAAEQTSETAARARREAEDAATKLREAEAVLRAAERAAG